jgi:hypothetical protein
LPASLSRSIAKGEQEPLDGDVGVTRLLRDLLGLIQNARQRRRHLRLAGAAAGHLRQLFQRRFDIGQSLSGIAARTVDQARAQSFRIVEQNLQQMFGGELGVALAEGQRMRRLNEAAHTLGVFLKIHMSLPRSDPRPFRRHLRSIGRACAALLFERRGHAVSLAMMKNVRGMMRRKTQGIPDTPRSL